MKGCFVISLDYEMMWGVKSFASPDGYGASNIKHVNEAIDNMLELFEKYKVNVTFAVVGLLFKNGKNDAISSSPNLKPTYKNQNLSPYYNDYIENIRDEDEKLYFAPEQIKKLKGKNNVEIATHTFCHYYCWENGQTIEQFEADLEAMKSTASANGIELKSIVFPRNEVSTNHLVSCKKFGIKYYRGNAVKFFKKPSNRFHGVLNKALRMIDSYVNIGGYMTTNYDDIDDNSFPMNIPASRFLRPYNRRLRLLDCLKLHRIKKEMLYAAKHNELYHLWWHPHNMGANLNKNMCFLEKVLSYYKYCNGKYGMESYTMSEFAEQLLLHKE